MIVCTRVFKKSVDVLRIFILSDPGRLEKVEEDLVQILQSLKDRDPLRNVQRQLL